ncbi:MAG: rhamnulose-1-phosphate aldolase, partial [Eggerthellaceae bacterium]|nr:rhamnulose-1-phosphate aldolase [Eggerthellaceae bacterium]
AHPSLSCFEASEVADLSFVRDFARMCDEGWRHGWHERNGGNASYRLTDRGKGDVRACLGAATRVVGVAPACEVPGGDAANLPAPDHADSSGGEGERWVPLDVEAPELAGEWLLITATGSYMQNVTRDPESSLGIIELNEQGSAYRVVWGFAGGGRPTSEVSAHVLIHACKKTASQGAFRVLYHCHPTPIIALTHALGADARAITRLLWKMMTECVMVFPQGVGVVPCEVPGSMELARMTANAVRDHNAVIWAKHGLLATGESFDATFGLIHVIVKAAQIFESACIMAGGPAAVVGIPDEELPRIAEGLGVSLNPAYC